MPSAWLGLVPQFEVGILNDYPPGWVRHFGSTTQSMNPVSRGSDISRSASHHVMQPADVTVKQDDDTFYVEIDAGGYSEDELTVRVDDMTLVVEGSHQCDNIASLCFPRKFSRKWDLTGARVDIANISVQFYPTHGALRVTLPKVLQCCRKIAIETVDQIISSPKHENSGGESKLPDDIQAVKGIANSSEASPDGEFGEQPDATQQVHANGQ